MLYRCVCAHMYVCGKCIKLKEMCSIKPVLSLLLLDITLKSFVPSRYFSHNNQKHALRTTTRHYLYCNFQLSLLVHVDFKHSYETYQTQRTMQAASSS